MIPTKQSNPTQVSRRSFLKTLGLISAIPVALPILEISFGKRAFANSGFPKRYGLFFWGNGNRVEKWTPLGQGIGDAWSLSESLQPLQTFKEKITVCSGYSTKVPNYFPHTSGLVGLVTGQSAIGTEHDWTVAGPSIDQMLAANIGQDTVYPSLVLGCVSNRSVSWNGPNSWNPVETDPYALYERLFGPTFREPGEEGIIDPDLGFRRSALDFVLRDLNTLHAQLGTRDKIRLEHHMEGVRELELRLARLQEDPPSLQSCSRPEAPTADYSDIDSRPQFTERNFIMSKLMAMSYACDQTRVISYIHSGALNNLLFPNATDGHHNLTHHETGDQPQVAEVTRFVMEQFAHFLQELDSIPEGDGTLLDNCMICATSEVSEGKTHSLDEIPFVIAGGGNGSLQTNRHIRSFAQDNINKIHLTCLRAMGMNQVSLGADDSLTTDSIGDLEL